MPVQIDPYTGVATEINPTAGATSYRLLGNPAPTERSPFAAGVESAYAGLRFGLPQALEKSGALGMRLTPAEEQYYQAGLRGGAAESQALLPGGPVGVSDLISGEAGLGQLIKENIFYSGPQMLGTLAGSVAGAAVGGKNPVSVARNAMLGGTAAGTPMFVGSNVQRATEEGTKSLTEAGAVRSLIAAPAQAALETLVQKFLPVGPMAGGFSGNFLTRTAKAMGAAGATEAVTEPLQQVGERFAAEQDITSPTAFREYVEAAGTALLTGGAMGMFGGIRNGNTPKMTEQETTEYVDSAINEPQLLLESPDKFSAPLYANSEGQIDSSMNAVRDPRREGVIEPEVEPIAPVPNVQYPSSTADVFSGLDDEQLVGVLASAESKVAAGQAQPAEERIMRMARAEIARREVSGETQPAGGLFGPADDDVAAARVSELVQGVRPNQFIKKLQVADEVELADKVLEQLEEGDSRQGTMTLAQRLGIIDEAGNERDLDAELAAAQALGADGEVQAADIRAKKAVLEAVQLRRNPEAAPIVEPEVNTDQDVLPLETGLPDRLVQPAAATGTMADLLAPIQQRMLARQQAAERDQQFELAEAERAKATEAQVEQDYMAAKAQTYLQQVGEPVTMKEAEVLWMRGKPANIKGWQKISPEERQQWFDVLNQDVAIPDAKIVRSDISRGVPAEAPSALDELQGLREDIDGKVDEQTAVYQALNNRVNETFTPTVNVAPEGAARATTIKRMIEARLSPEIIEQAIEDAEAGLFDSSLGAKPTNINLLDDVNKPTAEELKARRMPRTIKKQRPEPAAPVTTSKTMNRMLASAANDGVTRSKAMNNLLKEIDTARDAGAIANVDRLKLISWVSQNRLDEVSEYLDDAVGTNESLQAAREKNNILKEEAVSRRDVLRGIGATAVTAMAAQAQARVPVGKGSRLLQKLRQGDIVASLKIIAAESPSGLNRTTARILLRADMGRLKLKVIDGEKLDSGTLQDQSFDQSDITPLTMGFVDLTNVTQPALYLIERTGVANGVNEGTFLHELIHAFVQARWSSISMYAVPTNREKFNIPDNARAVELVDRLTKIWDLMGEATMRAGGGELGTNMEASVFNSPDEFLSYALTKPEYQKLLRQYKYVEDSVGGDRYVPIGKGDGRSAWTDFVDWLRDVFGMSPINRTQRTALEDAIEAGHSLLMVGAQVAPDYNAARQVNEARGTLRDELVKSSKPGAKLYDTAPRTVAGMNEAVKQATNQGVELYERLRNTQDLTSKLRKAMMGWMSKNHMAQRYGNLFQLPDGTNGIQKDFDADTARAAIVAQLSQLFSNAYYSFEQLEKSSPKSAERVGYIMTATQYEIDPAKTFAEHDHLKDSPNADVLKKLIDGDPKDSKRYPGYNRTYNLLKKDGHVGVYEELKAVNEAQHYAMMAISVQSMIEGDPSTKNAPGFQVNPMDTFRNQSDLRNTAIDARDYWAKVVADPETGQMVRLAKLIEDTRGAGKAAPKEMAKAERYLQPLEKRLQSIRGSIAAMGQAPYFHLGRFGEHIVAFEIRRGLDKRIDPAAVEHIARELEKVGVTNVEIPRDALRSNVFIRLDSLTARNNVNDLMKRLQAEGWLTDKDVIAGVRTDNTLATEMAPEFLTRYIEEIRADSSLDDDIRDQMIAKARELWLDMLPDTALSKVMVHRNSVPGFEKDMLRNMAHRSMVGTYAIANLATAGMKSQAFSDMQSAIEAAQSYNAKDPGRKVFSGQEVSAMAAVKSELARRNAEKADRPEKNFIDTWRAVNHAHFLGLSPAYVMVNTTQIPVLLLPQLGSKHGYLKSAQAIGRATPIAFKVVKAVIQSGAALGWKRAADAVITEKVLKQAGIGDATAAFIMRVVNTGNIDIGSASREQGRVADGSIDSKTDLALRYAGAMGYYSEVLTRLISALAARELHGNAPNLDQYVSKVINDTMFNYAESNTARLAGDSGLFGRPSKIAFSFLTYSFQLMEKLYREVGTAFIDSGKTPAEKREARRFLAGHLAAVTVLAGSLGLPMASVAARAFEALADLFDDDEEPQDFKAAYRNWLVSMVGKDMGEVIARGVPRALGVDISSRVGEQDILPFSKLLTDRRKWEDSLKDNVVDMLGSPVSMFAGYVQGGRDILDGNVMQGMEAMAPIALKNAIKAYSMNEKGYTDRMGNKLPMTAGATDILTQALGFAPAEKAEYSEAKMSQTIRKAEAIREASNIRKNLAVAIERGDREEQLEWIRRARSFDADNPAYAVIPGMGSSLKQRAKARAMSLGRGVPIGVNSKDIGAQALSSYANY